MPKVPTVGLNASPLPGFQAPGVTAFRSAVPQQIQQSGKAMEGLGKAVTEVAFKIEDDINDAATLEANNAFEKFTQKSFQGFGQLKGQEAMRAKSGVLNDQDFERKAILEKLENNVQRKQFAKFADRLQSKFTLKVEEHYIGAVAENKQQQLLSTQTTIEDDIKANPLSPESISSFLRWQKTTEQIIAGQGIQGDLAKTVMTKRSSDFIKSIFNNYVDAGRSEDALKFVEAIQSFEENIAYDMKSARAAGLGPDETGHYPSRDPKTGLILKSQDHPTFHKTVKGEIEAGYEFWQDPKTERWYTFPKGVVDNPESRGLEKKDPPLLQGMTSPEQVSLLDGETRMLLRQKSEKVSRDAWVIKTVDNYESVSDALEDAEAKFTSGEWTSSQREAVEKRAVTVFDRNNTLRRIESSDALEAAKSEYIKSGKISEDTRDALDGLFKLDDFLGWVSRASNGKASDQGDALLWGAFQSAYNNPTGIAGIASTIKDREGLMLVYKQAIEKGATTSEAREWAVKIGEQSKYGEQKDLEKDLQGLSTSTDVEQYGTDWFGGQWGSVIEKSKTGDNEKSKEKAAATLALKADRTRQFKQAFNKKVRDLQSLNPDLNNEKLLERARSEAWQDGIRTYEVDGQVRKINTWTASPSDIKAAEIASSPSGTKNTLEAYKTATRIVGEPNDERRKVTIFEEATVRFAKENMSADLILKYRDRRDQVSQYNAAALRMMGLPLSISKIAGALGAADSFRLPQPGVAIDSPAGQFRLLQIAQEIQLEDTASLESKERQDQLKRELWSAINSDIEIDDWAKEALSEYTGGRNIMNPGKVFLLERRYTNSEGPIRDEWEGRGMTPESYTEVLKLHPTFAKSRDRIPTRNYWTPQPYPEGNKAPKAVEAGR